MFTARDAALNFVFVYLEFEHRIHDARAKLLPFYLCISDEFQSRFRFLGLPSRSGSILSKGMKNRSCVFSNLLQVASLTGRRTNHGAGIFNMTKNQIQQ